MNKKFIEFIIPGHPVAKARARVTRNGTYTPEATQDYKKVIQVYAMQAMQGILPIKGECLLSINIYRRAKTTSRPDIDNYCKAVMDGCNGIIWVDDSQVTKLYSTKSCIAKDQEELIGVEVGFETSK